ncbi:aldose epimerase family protein [Virgibacillus senegalensis]|uniref:aldose epimerase family protein n=1 Tax=Virgibacillus senegalensis TaxID=1499679 RepID=UPI00069E2C09|nr:aldose epimerase family protein [Virgibacillus senegalensis]
MQIKQEQIKLNSWKTWKRFTLSNDRGIELSCLDFGGIITEILAPDKHGQKENIVVGYKNYEDYLDNPNFFGALIGRVAGRIEGSSFSLNGETYQLPPNEGENHLHGGPGAFHQTIWQTETFEKENTVGIVFTQQWEDGHNGYPGNLDMKITYTLDNNNQFSITYQGSADKDTVLTTTNHSYFNLSGNLKTGIQKHNVTFDSSQFVELDEALIPTGNKLDVNGTVFDFQEGRNIEDGIHSDNQQNIYAGHGYDHFFTFDKNPGAKVSVVEKNSGRKMIVETDQPGMVMYTSNGLGEGLQLKERESAPYLGVCFETQSSPASIHHEGFPSCFLPAGEDYYSRTVFQFGLVE